MNKEKILEVLEQYKQDAETKGYTVYAIALKGSQNYNLSDEESDIDANPLFLPTIPQLRKKDVYKAKYDTGEVTGHNIYDFAEIVAKGNPQWIEVCHSDYYIGDFSLFKHYKLNPSALKGMLMEKVTAFKKLYPSREKFVKQFGYDPKQLHHIIRLYDLLEKDVNVYKYTDKEASVMLDIKRGRFPASVEEADKMKDDYVSYINEIYQSKKEAYQLQEVDYDLLDSLVLNYYKGL